MFRDRTIAAAVAIGLLWCPPSAADKLEKALRSEWNGRWVVLKGPFTSDCNGLYTNYRVGAEQREQRGPGRFARLMERAGVMGPIGPMAAMQNGAPAVSRDFAAGELGQVYKLKLRKSGIDLLVDVHGPVLQPNDRGPFTLYDEGHCKVQLQIEASRSAIKAGKTGALEPLEDLLARIAEPFERAEQARASSNWNGRERDDYPENYLKTVRDFTRWQNAAIDIQLESAFDIVYEMAQTYPDHLKSVGSFAKGAWRTSRDLSSRRCDDLIDLDFSAVERELGLGGYDPGDDIMENDVLVLLSKGPYREGQHLAFALEMLERLPECRLSVAELVQEGL